MRKEILDHYKLTSTYTYAGAYENYFKSLPDDVPTIGMLVCGQVTHPTLFFTPVSSYLEDKYFGKFNSYQNHRFKEEDELFITSAAMTAELFRLDERGFIENKDVTKRITVSCRQASVLLSAILKAKGIPCRSRAGFIDFGNDGSGYVEHWVNEYWNEKENRWVLVDADGYYEFEHRFGYSQFDLPARKFIPAADAWLGLRYGELNEEKFNMYRKESLDGAYKYLFMDFHALMNNEIAYTFQPKYLYGKFNKITKDELTELDELAKILKNPDDNFDEIKKTWDNNEKFYKLTNNGQSKLETLFTQ